ncbi:MAG: L-2-amino-thiazoline-4-carboxylic acid hydrolase [Candidatus Thorarchaeota archaeon]|jgi:hypothetical protein
MSQDDKALREQLWERLQEIGGSYKDHERLRTLLDQWEEDFGVEYQHIIDDLIAERARQYWRRMSSLEGNTLEDLVRTMWKPWTEGEFTFELTGDVLQIQCTKCPIAEGYRAIRREQYGVLFHCNEDSHIAAGFNPNIEFSCTKTLMEGDEYCNHCYSLR